MQHSHEDEVHGYREREQASHSIIGQEEATRDEQEHGRL